MLKHKLDADKLSVTLRAAMTVLRNANDRDLTCFMMHMFYGLLVIYECKDTGALELAPNMDLLPELSTQGMPITEEDAQFIIQNVKLLQLTVAHTRGGGGFFGD